MEYRPFKEAREFVRSLRIRDTSEWEQYSKSRKRPADIPSHPNFVYKNQGWKGYGDWLGTGRIAYQNINRRSYSADYERTQNIRIPQGYAFPSDPTLMQLYVAYKVKNSTRFWKFLWNWRR